jgi:hypothetical protein
LKKNEELREHLLPVTLVGEASKAALRDGKIQIETTSEQQAPHIE